MDLYNRWSGWTLTVNLEETLYEDFMLLSFMKSITNHPRCNETIQVTNSKARILLVSSKKIRKKNNDKLIIAKLAFGFRKEGGNTATTISTNADQIWALVQVS
jgi:hypothetical protein